MVTPLWRLPLEGAGRSIHMALSDMDMPYQHMAHSRCIRVGSWWVTTRGSKAACPPFHELTQSCVVQPMMCACCCNSHAYPSDKEPDHACLTAVGVLWLLRMLTHNVAAVTAAAAAAALRILNT
eukprot:1138181-Pelagomonas_calceolata.AAC.3